MLTRENPILLIDGDCVLCNRSARWIIRRDPGGRVLFSTLRSPRASAILQDRGLTRPPEGTAILIHGQEIFLRSEAILRVLAELPFPWPMVSRLGLSIPRPLRDTLYSIVARLRILLFGRTSNCAILTAAEKCRFLS